MGFNSGFKGLNVCKILIPLCKQGSHKRIYMDQQLPNASCNAHMFCTGCWVYKLCCPENSLSSSSVTSQALMALSWPSSNSLFKGLQRCLCPFGLFFSIIFGILLLLILVTCCSQFNLYLLSFQSTGSISHFHSFFLPLWSRKMYVAVLLKNLISIDASNFLSFFSKDPNFASI